MQGAMIDTGGPQGSQDTIYTDQTIAIFLQILSYGCKFSHLMIAQIIHDNALQAIVNLLPSEDKHQDLPPFVNDLMSLINLMLPQTDVDRKQQQKLIIFGPRQVYPPSEDASSPYQMLKTAQTQLEAQKQEICAGLETNFFEFLAETLLPKLFFLYRINVGQTFRERCISIIDKALAALPDAIATEKIDPVSLAQLVNQILATGTGQQVLIVLQITSRAIQSNPVKFVIPFQREGACQVIVNLAASSPHSLQKYDAEQGQPAAQEPQGFMSLSEQRVINLQKGLFGRKATEEEAIDMLNLEVEKIKGILSMAQGSIPASKKDMLTIALKDKELQLQMLKESQAVKKEAERLQKATEEAKAAEESKAAEQVKKAAEGANDEGAKSAEGQKGEAQEAAEEEKKTEKKEEPAKTSVLIKQES